MKAQWSQILENLKNSLESGVFRVMVAPLEATVESGCLTLTAPNSFMADWVRGRLVGKIQQAAAPILDKKPEEVQVQIKVGQIAARPAPAASIVRNVLPKREQAELPVAVPQANAVWRFRFDDFVTGSSNSLAVAAARDICQAGQVRTLFVTSASGLGKTHLVQATGQLISQSRQPLKVAYLTAEQFASRFVAAMRSKELEDFKQKLCKVDVLLLEDVHFLQRKKAMQEMVLAIVKNLEARGRRVIFTSSFAPRQLQDVDTELTSHFCSGILARMDKPDADMRREILQRKAHTFQVNLPDDVCTLLSDRLSSDVRQLESCLRSMIFKAKVLNAGLTVDLAMETVGEYAAAETSLDLNSIVRLVCESFGLTEVQLRSRSRKHEYVQGRNTVFYLARKHTELSLEGIGSALNRKHSTVMRSITQVEEELARQTVEGRRIARAVELIERKCGLR